jgi:hypothetical protein
MKAKSILGIVALLLISTVSYGDDELGWDSLSESQQTVLSEFREDWDKLPPKRRERLSRGAEHRLAMSDDERKDAKARFSDWGQLSSERRDLIRERYDIYSSLSPDEQKRIRENFHRFNRMNHDRRQKMRDRYRNMTPEQRKRARERMRDRPRPKTRD